MNETRKIFMVCQDEETRKDAADMLKRVSSIMAAVETFVDKLTELDEDAPGAEELAWPMLNRLMLTLMNIYPNGPQQMQVDIKSIGDFTVYAPGEDLKGG
jgi:hypothetical protein